VRNGKFFKTIATGYGDRFQLVLNDKYNRDIFLEPGEVIIQVSDMILKNVIVKNNQSAIENQIYSNEFLQLPSTIKFRKASSEYLESATDNIDSLKRMKFLNDSLKKIYVEGRIKHSLATIRNNPKSLINSSLLTYVADEIPQAEVMSLFKILDSKARNNAYGRYLKFKIDSLFIGSIAPDFKQTDTGGKIIHLKDYRGRFVILDFWASWCIPCRVDNPNLVNAMLKFKDKKFTIISVSLDSDRSKWMEAIHQDGLEWIHISDLKDWGNEVARKYRITAIPDNFILDPNGKIIARRVQGNDLIRILSAYLN
jgi:peroxiredoxin